VNVGEDAEGFGIVEGGGSVETASTADGKESEE
jgi:hypothetical protein